MFALSDAEFSSLTAFVRERYGINLEKKRSLVETRLSSALERTGRADYLQAALEAPDGEECRDMMNRLTTGYTFFFREPRSFEYLARRAFTRPGAGEPLDVWCAACASGEEAYSISMTLNRCAPPDGVAPRYRILATDINTAMLKRAERGLYPASALASIPADFRRFARREGEIISMRESVSRPISWRRENLLACERLSCMDVIFCRNVMIYFAPEKRRRLVGLLHAALRPGGYLFISGAECIDLGNRLFRRVEPAIYRKRDEPL